MFLWNSLIAAARVSQTIFLRRASLGNETGQEKVFFHKYFCVALKTTEIAGVPVGCLVSPKRGNIILKTKNPHDYNNIL